VRHRSALRRCSSGRRLTGRMGGSSFFFFFPPKKGGGAKTSMTIRPAYGRGLAGTRLAGPTFRALKQMPIATSCQRTAIFFAALAGFITARASKASQFACRDKIVPQIRTAVYIEDKQSSRSICWKGQGQSTSITQAASGVARPNSPC